MIDLAPEKILSVVQRIPRTIKKIISIAQGIISRQKNLIPAINNFSRAQKIFLPKEKQTWKFRNTIRTIFHDGIIKKKSKLLH
ncbi:MAG TPA: hypothetical protein DDW50_01175 [Firmicutes bacterium]|jgi:hypothetical protein|nr:hypothetical protein [Bacillota bacterium]